MKKLDEDTKKEMIVALSKYALCPDNYGFACIEDCKCLLCTDPCTECWDKALDCLRLVEDGNE